MSGRPSRPWAQLGSDAGYVALGQICSFAYPLVAIPWLSHALGVAGLGRLLVIFAVTQISILLVDFGFAMSALRNVARAADDRARQHVVSATLTAKLSLWVLGAALVLGLIVAVPEFRAQFVSYLIGQLAVLGAVFYPAWLLQGCGRVKTFAVITAVSRLVALAGLTLTVHDADDQELAVAWQFVPYVLAAGLAWLVIRRADLARLRLSGLRQARAALADSTLVFVNSLGIMVIANSSTILLGGLSTSVQVGLFGSAERMSNAVRGVLSGVQLAMLGRLSRDRPTEPDRGRPAEATDPRRIILTGSVTAFAVAGIAMIVLAPALVPWYLGSAFTDAVGVAQLLGVALAVTGVTSTLSLELIAAGRAAVCTRVTVIGAGLHLVLVTVGALQLGAAGAALALIVTETWMALALVGLSRNRTQLRPAPTDLVRTR